MAWVEVVAPEDATGLVKQIYESGRQGKKQQSEIVTVFSLKPEIMDLRVRFGDGMTFGIAVTYEVDLRHNDHVGFTKASGKLLHQKSSAGVLVRLEYADQSSRLIMLA